MGRWQETDRIESLGRVARSVCSVDGPGDCGLFASATAYVRFERNGQTVGTDRVRVELWASLKSYDHMLAAALVPPGYNGLAVTASGVQADQFFIAASSNNPHAAARFSLGVKDCCSGFHVFVPPALTVSPVPHLSPPADDYWDQDINPSSQEFGQYWMINGTQAGGTVEWSRRRRVTHIRMKATGVNGNVQFRQDNWTLTYNVTAGETLEALPKGNLLTDRVVWTNSALLLVEGVR